MAAPEDAPQPNGSPCNGKAPLRAYDVTAIAVDTTLNRFLDHDPQGRMFALTSEVPRIRAEEVRNAAARAGRGESAVTLGLQGDAIQPLVLRVVPGDCLRIVLRNALPDGGLVDLHLHGAGLQIPGKGPAISTNPAGLVTAPRPVTYEWLVPKDEPEGTHYFHSHVQQRRNANHGLFGTLVVEPTGSQWIDPRTGREAGSIWDAMIVPKKGRSFREFVLVYHEVGDETYQVLDRTGKAVPLVDPTSDAYRPGSRALNFRSEPFLNRLALGQQRTGHVDKSLAYSSYTYGDPATPILRTELGDPTKQRIVHGGSEVFHVHHVHGGSIRWPRQPGADGANALKAIGIEKKPDLVPKVSERTDSQSLGPTETFDVVDECGAGGCQQSAGDFLFHCHIAHHYFAGMWGLWRVYNTRQDGPASTDAMPALLPLPDRQKAVSPAVSAAALAGTSVAFFGTETKVTAAGLDRWVERQLPPSGTPKTYDASVWNWTREGDRVLGEPETADAWPGYASKTPGKRPEVLFDPRTGKPAYPFLRPHLAARPPFAPDHGPSPFLDLHDGHDGHDPPKPGAGGKGSLCPTGTRPQGFQVDGISSPVTQNEHNRTIDSSGLLYVLHGDAERTRADPARQVPLAIRANAGQDCVDVLLRNEVADGPNLPFSKLGLHIHFVQFDVQGSDGLDAGFNFEQTVRPYRQEGTAMAAATAAGASSVRVVDANRFQPGALVGVGADQGTSFEARKIVAVRGTTLRLDAPLTHPHAVGEVVSTEFVRYRWYPDAQFGTSYFHDHVDAIHGWRHGLFGALIAEPPGSTYTDPVTGKPLRSGPIADIHTDARVSTDVKGSFRELALFVQDDNPLSSVGRSTGSAYNLRAEPLDRRGGEPSKLFSSTVHGDPATPVLRANLGDPVVIRSLVGATNDVHTIHVDGHWFRSEPWSTTSRAINTIRVGISERFDLVVDRAGGPQRMPGDYLYYSGRSFKLREGSWGIVRVLPAASSGLRPLPGHEKPVPAATEVCAPKAPVKRFAVSVVEAPLPMLGGGIGKLYVLDRDRAAVLSGKKRTEPLVLHVNVGDCVQVRLTNATATGSVTYKCELPADPATSGGVAAGNEPDRSVAPGKTGTFTFFASPAVGETVALVRDWGDVLRNPGKGLYGAIVVGPKGATYRGEGTQVVVVPKNGRPYRDATLFLQDQDEGIGTHRMPYSAKVSGTVALNYASAPFVARLGSQALSAPPHELLGLGKGDPPTAVVRAHAGDPLTLHVVSPFSEQVQVFGVEGHEWPVEPGLRESTMVSVTAIGGLEALTLPLAGGAGGRDERPGDYVFGAERGAYLEAGMWGILRVLPKGAPAPGLQPL